MTALARETVGVGAGPRCACGLIQLGPLGTPRDKDGIEHRWGFHCRPLALAGRYDTPPPWRMTGEPQ